MGQVEMVYFFNKSEGMLWKIGRNAKGGGSEGWTGGCEAVRLCRASEQAMQVTRPHGRTTVDPVPIVASLPANVLPCLIRLMHHFASQHERRVRLTAFSLSFSILCASHLHQCMLLPSCLV